MKLAPFLKLLACRPAEALHRIEGMFDIRFEHLWVSPPQYAAAQLELILEGLELALQADLRLILREGALAEIEELVRGSMQLLPPDAPFAASHSADFLLARLCYALCRASRPSVAVETGVCYGVTSAFLLKAMQVNGRGELHSIDLPPLGAHAEAFVGRLVPDRLHPRWRLYRGASKLLLPRVLQRVGSVDLFVHDSLHTRRNMRRELATVTSRLGRPAVVICDDIEGNATFGQWLSTAQPQFSGIVQEGSKASLFGVALLLGDEGSRQAAAVATSDPAGGSR